MQGRIYKANGGDILDILGFVGDVGAGGFYILTLAHGLGPGGDRFRNCRLRNEVHDRRRAAEFYCRGRRIPHRDRKEEVTVTITLNHFSAALVFSLFASVVFGITHRETTRDMVRYGLYCFAMFLGGVFVAGWAMWLLRR